jgi:hypothetical protein
VWHENIARGDHEYLEGVMESDCALVDHNNALYAESNVHCDTDTYISDGNMCIAGSSSNNNNSSSTSSSSSGIWIADSNMLYRY